MVLTTAESSPLAERTSRIILGEHIRGLDGLRAISIILVIVAHSGFAKVPGSLGVTIFFFVSGFLITQLLLHEISDRGKINIKNFYIRRYLRLTPELFTYLLLSIVLSKLFFVPERWDFTISALIYVMNYAKIYLSNPNDFPFAITHFWSLSVEEHFYLTWPVILSFSIRRKRPLLIVVIVMILMPIIFRTYSYIIDRPIDYLRYASECRFDSIAYGCAFSIMLANQNKVLRIFEKLSHWSLIIAVVLLFLFTYGKLIGLRGVYHEIFTYCGQGIGMFFLFGYMFSSSSSAVLLLVLEKSFFRFIGRASYGMYIWHFAIINLLILVLGYSSASTMPYFHKAGVAIVACAVSSIVGWLSYKLILGPFSDLRRKYGSDAKPAPGAPNIG